MKKGFRFTSTQFLFLLVFQGCLYCGVYSTLFPPIVLFVIISLLSSAVYAVIAWQVISDPDGSSRSLFFSILAAGILFRIILLWHDPVGSDDIYRYIWDGKIQSAGIDPYRYEPLNPALQSFHSPLLPAKINFAGMKTIYPPLAEWFFAAVYFAAGESIVGFKIALFIVELLSISFLLILLRKWNVPLRYASLYLLCPLPILHFALDGHCDLLMFPFLLGMLYFFVKGEKILSSCMMGFAAIAKIYPLLFLPAFFARREWKSGWYVVLILLAIIFLSYLPSIIGGGNPFESLTIYSLNWAANGFLFELCYMMLRNNQYAHIVMAAVFLGWLIFVLQRNRPFPEMLYEILLGFFLCSATVHPWYLTALALMLPFVPRNSGIALATLGSLATIPLITYVLEGRWYQSVWLMMLEYLPVYYLVWLEFFPHKAEGKENSSFVQ